MQIVVYAHCRSCQFSQIGRVNSKELNSIKQLRSRHDWSPKLLSSGPRCPRKVPSTFLQTIIATNKYLLRSSPFCLIWTAWQSLYLDGNIICGKGKSISQRCWFKNCSRLNRIKKLKQEANEMIQFYFSKENRNSALYRIYVRLKNCGKKFSYRTLFLVVLVQNNQKYNDNIATIH